eukprot:6833772-Lingulodinium_polyedra.AAC.1
MRPTVTPRKAGGKLPSAASPAPLGGPVPIGPSSYGPREAAGHAACWPAARVRDEGGCDAPDARGC